MLIGSNGGGNSTEALQVRKQKTGKSKHSLVLVINWF
jgi:hypothetical protein